MRAPIPAKPNASGSRYRRAAASSSLRAIRSRLFGSCPPVTTIAERELPGRSGRSRQLHEQMRVLALYLVFSALGHLIWEIVQLPLYGLWHTAPVAEITFAVLHCTAGDLLIATSVLLVSLVALRAWRWPRDNALRVAILAIALGIAYTAYSEWHNVYVRRSWSYAEAMPTLEILGYRIGASPLAQWLVVPAMVFLGLAKRGARDNQPGPELPAP